ncbi:hypothetical protein BH09BAC6_BH09BAC6_25960 [soil metagenome]|jgi:hypothetical protein
MKTSNKLFLAALLVFVAALAIYDLGLRDSYLVRRDKGPYGNFTDLKLKNFNAIDLQASTIANIKLVQGPFKVLIDPAALDRVRVTQEGATLHIAANFKGEYYNDGYPYVLVISCPGIKAFTANAKYTKNNGQPVTDTIVHEEWNFRQCLIEGFMQDSLAIVQDYGSTVNLSGNQIRALNAVVGTSELSGSKLVVLNNNQIKNASLNILNRSRLIMNGRSIQNLNYNLADSAKMILTGGAQNILNNAKPYRK